MPAQVGKASYSDMNSKVSALSRTNLDRLDEQWRIVAYLDGLPPSLRFGDLRQAKVNAFPLTAKRFGDNVRGLQSQSQEELDALLPSVLDRAFKGEL